MPLGQGVVEITEKFKVRSAFDLGAPDSTSYQMWDGNRWIETDDRGVPLEVLERYHIDVSWTLYRHGGFLTTPIGKWSFWPILRWERLERGFAWLWFVFEWTKRLKYTEREDWLWPKEKKDE